MFGVVNVYERVHSSFFPQKDERGLGVGDPPFASGACTPDVSGRELGRSEDTEATHASGQVLKTPWWRKS